MRNKKNHLKKMKKVKSCMQKRYGFEHCRTSSDYSERRQHDDRSDQGGKKPAQAVF